MPRRASAHPTEAELEILNVLWEHGASTVRQVHEALQADRKTGLTTTLKLLQVMATKGLVIRDDHGYPQRFRPAAPQQETQSKLLDDLIQRAFGGSAQKLLVRAVRDKKLSGPELREIRDLIDRRRIGKRGGK
jgi:predicted transcriptional regulator